VAEAARRGSVPLLNRLLADTIALYHLYKKHHWQAKGPTFYQLHLLFDKHADEQLALVDRIAERIQSLGGVAVGMPADVAEATRLARPPRGIEAVPAMLSRLLEAHGTVAGAIDEGIAATERSKDWGTNDLLMSDLLRAHQAQAWFLAEHLLETTMVRA